MKKLKLRNKDLQETLTTEQERRREMEARSDDLQVSAHVGVYLAGGRNVALQKIALWNQKVEGKVG